MDCRVGAVFLDRDGVLNEDHPSYVRTLDDFRLLPGAVNAVRHLTDAGWRVIVVTNQAGIGRGIVSPAAVREMHSRLCAEVSEGGGRISRVFCCPHRPDEGCGCRKPAPGMLFQAARELDIDLSASYLVGDYLTDIDAGLAAGCTPILVLTGRGQEALAVAGAGARCNFLVADDLAQAVELILRRAALRIA